MMSDCIASQNPYQKTYCNPTPLPDYPLGKVCRDGAERRMDFRETADPTVLYEDGVWYLYPSCGMAYRSEDFIHWEHIPMIPDEIGYAPTVVKHRGRFLLLASGSQMYQSDCPTGPFSPMGPLRDVHGNAVGVSDPDLFADGDRLYLYSGCGGEIRGVELDADDPCRMLGENVRMFAMQTEEHPWERMGDHGEDGSFSWIEGAWMYKRGDTYYLTYSAPGTEWYTYGMGAYKSHAPLGPWEYMTCSPFLQSERGLVRGTGHGCLVDGPNGTTWVFYTCCVCYAHMFERRIGYDLLNFDENGDIIPMQASESPRLAPTFLPEPYQSHACDLVPLSQRKPTVASSCAPGRDALYATDDSMLSFWQPDAAEAEPTLTVRLSEKCVATVVSARLIWRDVGLDIEKGHLPGAFGYRIEACTPDGEWQLLSDRSDNKTDMLIDYIVFDQPLAANRVRLTITSKPPHIEPGLINFTVFGHRIRA